MDKWDRAQENEDLVTEGTIRGIRNKANQSSLLFCGFCYYCDEVLRSPHIFCNAECRDDFEREQRLRTMAGKG